MSKYTYAITNSLSFFRKLLDEREDFLKNPQSARYAINAALTAWHLHEWIYAEYEHHPYFKTELELKVVKDYSDYLTKTEVGFAEMRDLADGSKHFKLGREDKNKTHVLGTPIIGTHNKGKWAKWNDGDLGVRSKFGNGGMLSTFDDELYIVTLYWFTLLSDTFKQDVSFFVKEGYTLF